MSASDHIGRVGTLAVALGIGAAVSMGPGIAWADEAPSDPTTTEPPSNAAGVETDADTTAGAATLKSAIDTSVTTRTPEKTGDLDRSLTALTTRADSLLSALHRAAERGIAMSTGGALTSRELTRQSDVGAPDDVEAKAAGVVEVADTRPAEKKSSGHAGNPVEGLFRHLPTARQTVDAPIANTHVASAFTTADSVKAVAQRIEVPAERNSFPVLARTTNTQGALPTMTARTAAPEEQPTAPRLLTNLMSVFGLAGLASNAPGAPFGTPIVMALLALGVRRESEFVTTTGRTAAQGTSPVATLALADPPVAAVAAPYDPATGYVVIPTAVSPNTDLLTNVTGSGGLNDTAGRFGIGGTDLGIMWDNGIRGDNPATPVVEQRQVLIAFGDTFRNANPPRTGDWTINTLLRSSDLVLSNGMYVKPGVPGDIFSGSPMKPATVPSVPSPGYAVGPEVTIIPTSGISAPYPNAYGSRQYMSIMSVRSWDQPGFWTTNYSGIAYSDDNGQTWKVAPESIRPAATGRSTRPYISGNQNFQQSAFVKPPAGSPEAAAGYVYAYGTPSGRGGTVYLSRVKQDQILDQTKYEYWNGKTWQLNTPSAATPVLPGTTTSSFFGLFKRTTYPTAGEMSVQYNQYEKKYIMLYADQNNNIVMRKADRPEGPWSAPTTLVTSSRMPGLYAPMINPWSSENVQESEKQYLYWSLSTWGDYEVKSMRTDLTKV